MYKKLDDAAIESLLEVGIDEFADKGLDRANINHIAERAQVSVGVIYKYYHDKDQFFIACVEHSLKLLETTMQEVIASADDIEACIRLLLKELIDGADKHRNYYVMYNEITSGRCQKFAIDLARKIEGRTSKIYAELVEKAQQEGKLKYKGNPQMFAYFFDSILMMMQFSFSCEYYKERLKIFCGEEILDNKEKLAESFLGVMSSALGIET